MPKGVPQRERILTAADALRGGIGRRDAHAECTRVHPYNALHTMDEIRKAAAERGKKLGVSYAGALLPAEAQEPPS